jgi:hypothetical protein
LFGNSRMLQINSTLTLFVVIVAVREKMLLNRAKCPVDKVRGDPRKYNGYPER